MFRSMHRYIAAAKGTCMVRICENVGLSNTLCSGPRRETHDRVALRHIHVGPASGAGQAGVTKRKQDIEAERHIGLVSLSRQHSLKKYDRGPANSAETYTIAIEQATDITARLGR